LFFENASTGAGETVERYADRGFGENRVEVSLQHGRLGPFEVTWLEEWDMKYGLARVSDPTLCDPSTCTGAKLKVWEGPRFQSYGLRLRHPIPHPPAIVVGVAAFLLAAVARWMFRGA
jgi:hypothetical protein